MINQTQIMLIGKKGKAIIYSTEALESNLWNFYDSYILLSCDATILGRNAVTNSSGI